MDGIPVALGAQERGDIREARRVVIRAEAALEWVAWESRVVEGDPWARESPEGECPVAGGERLAG
jgi:hypothetical protein